MYSRSGLPTMAPAFPANPMVTTHATAVGDARDLPLPEDSVELVVTSPPYPMIEMWDRTFAALEPAVETALERGNGDEAFTAMHGILDDAWSEVARVLVDGGIAVINIGDATRSIGDSFSQYPNAARITQSFRERGFSCLPQVIWRKPTNSVTKFMGSRMLPPNAYVTLDHERLLVFRNGGRRQFEAGAARRYQAAYFWEERNTWFSDVWEITGTSQTLDSETRERSGAFPVEIPFRLVNMFSTYDDTVLDPFWGTGTTTVGAMYAGRHSVGIERDRDLVTVFDDRLDGLPGRSRDRQRDRLVAHEAFIDDRRRSGDPAAYEATHYGFPVVTKQEREIRLFEIDAVSRVDADAPSSSGVSASGSDTATDPAASSHLPDPARRYLAHHRPVSYAG